jgi:NADH-quinone oxidoreductase subunit L
LPAAGRDLASPSRPTPPPCGGSRGLGNRLWQIGDVVLIDGLVVNGSAKLVGWFSSIVRHIQTGLLYHYAFAMIIGVLMLLTLFVII